MAEFYGTVVGSRSEASRLGGKNSGLRVAARSWEGSVIVSMRHNSEEDKTYCEIGWASGSSGIMDKVLYSGPVEELGNKEAFILNNVR